jgi:hypothetical protein
LKSGLINKKTNSTLVYVQISGQGNLLTRGRFEIGILDENGLLA